MQWHKNVLHKLQQHIIRDEDLSLDWQTLDISIKQTHEYKRRTHYTVNHIYSTKLRRQNHTNLLFCMLSPNVLSSHVSTPRLYGLQHLSN